MNTAVSDPPRGKRGGVVSEGWGWEVEDKIKYIWSRVPMKKQYSLVELLKSTACSFSALCSLTGMVR